MTTLPEYLRQLGNDPTLRPRNAVEGICSILKYFPWPEGFCRGDMFAAWGEFSGNLIFPVPHPLHSPDVGYMAADDVWEGEYGDTRRRLCLHCADWIERLEREQNVRTDTF